MKKALLLSLFFLGLQSVFGQILSRTESWPDATWSLGGSFTPAAILSNPTTADSQLKYDTALVTPSGGPTFLTLSSPSFSLQPAFDGGEKVITITFDIAFQTLALNVLSLKYWDADASSWTPFPDGSADIETLGDFATCSLSPVAIFLDYSGFTVNQLQNFRYQFEINDSGNQLTGICLAAPVVTSFACVDPSGLTTTVVNADNATIDWTVNGLETFWKLQFGLTGFTPDPFTNTGPGLEVNSHPAVIPGLDPNTTYDVYVAADCAGGDGDAFSNPIGPLTFTTATLSLKEFAIDNLKLSSNPTHGQLELSGVNVNEVAIYNLSGQRLFNKKFNASTVNLDLSTFNTGLYFLKVFTDSGTGVYKIIKN